MRGGSQPHLIRADDENYYVVKFQNNPQGLRALVNDFLGSKIAMLLGLPVAAPQIIIMAKSFIQDEPNLMLNLPSGPASCVAGPQFASKYVCDPLLTQAFDFLPDSFLRSVVNLESFYGMLAFDLWACNTDCRQVIFHSSPPISIFSNSKNSSDNFVATMIDQGYCFNGNQWNFPDSPFRGFYRQSTVYRKIRSIEDFEPILDRILAVKEDDLMSIIESLPRSWTGQHKNDLRLVVTELVKRAPLVRMMILNCIDARPSDFPNWQGRKQPTSLAK